MLYLRKKDNAKYNVLLTLKGNENRYAKLLYKQYSSLKTITFGGLLSYEEVYEKYNKIDCLIFPSKLETWGLPISEFMAFDKPMLIADLPYAHETAAGAKYVAFFNPDTPKMLADRMSEVINGDLFNFSSVPLVNIELPEGGNLAASKIRNLECPNYEICLIDYGCGKFNRKIHIMEQYP